MAGRLIFALALIAAIFGAAVSLAPESKSEAAPARSWVAAHERVLTGQQITHTLTTPSGPVYVIKQPSGADRGLDQVCMLFVETEGRTSAFACPPQ